MIMLFITQCRVEIFNADFNTLNSRSFLEDFMLQVIEIAGLHVVHSHFHCFSPQGITGTFVLSESHFSVHSWPERGYALFEFVSCGDRTKLTQAVALFDNVFGAKNIQKQIQEGEICEQKSHWN